MSKFAVLVAVALLCAGSLAHAAAIQDLDGMTFAGELGEEGQTEGQADTFIFENGLFESTACTPFGFSEAPYTSAAQGDDIAFNAQTASPTDGNMVWQGTVDGDEVEGTVIWTKAGQATNYWFRGEIEEESASQ
ncbi:MAG: hypothetical protein HYY14_03950 [Candidatus Omnitrophica bacterium]|nr:hypothetical protein [Candidatus Omnitrophota bacterium]